MKTVAFAFLLLMVGCVPSASPTSSDSVAFVYEEQGGQKTAYLVSSEGGTVRAFILEADGVDADAVCIARGTRAVNCGVGTVIGAYTPSEPRGYRVNFVAEGPVIGVGCVQVAGGAVGCSDLKRLP